MKDRSNQINAWRGLIDERLNALGPGALPHGGKLAEAAAYVATGGGKRLRALLTVALEHDLSEGRRVAPRSLSSAVAIEVLHAASLVHDDLPALDNDDIRRGKPSCHKAFGEGTAILVGDALVGVALELVLSDEALSTDLRARLARVLSRVWRELCVGQQLDISGSRQAAPADRDLMTRLKTGALFGASVACGALCAGVYDAAVERFFSWGVRVGECFQALDDLDDGDRPESDRASIYKDCDLVREALNELLGGGARGATHDVMRVVLNQSS